MIDRINIQSGIRNIANEIFITSEISDKDVDIFVNDIVSFITKEFDSYVVRNEKEYIYFIPECNKSQFKDFSNGYVRMMQEWIQENPVQIRRIEVPVEKIVEKLPNNDSVKKALKTVGIGSVVTLGISFFTSSLISIIAELIVLGIAYKVYKHESNTREVEKMVSSIDDVKERFIENVISESSSWLDKAENQSAKLLESYK